MPMVRQHQPASELNAITSFEHRVRHNEWNPAALAAIEIDFTRWSN
jgi:hypothetical protein